MRIAGSNSFRKMLLMSHPFNHVSMHDKIISTRWPNDKVRISIPVTTLVLLLQCQLTFPSSMNCIYLALRSSKTTAAALRPGAPITPPPGCAPLPHRYSPFTGVL